MWHFELSFVNTDKIYTSLFFSESHFLTPLVQAEWGKMEKILVTWKLQLL